MSAADNEPSKIGVAEARVLPRAAGKHGDTIQFGFSEAPSLLWLKHLKEVIDGRLTASPEFAYAAQNGRQIEFVTTSGELTPDKAAHLKVLVREIFEETNKKHRGYLVEQARGEAEEQGRQRDEAARVAQLNAVLNEQR